MRHVRLFISAVTKEFGTYRDALRRQLQRPNVTVHVQEDFIPTGTETLDMLDLYIGQCDAVIHICGDMTGADAKPASVDVVKSRYPDLATRCPSLRPTLETGVPPISYTQWEAYLAVYHGKPLLIAEPEKGVGRDLGYMADPVQQALQKTHREHLRGLERYAVTFASEENLIIKVLRSPVLDLLAQAGAAAEKPIALPYSSLGTLFKGRNDFLAQLRDSLRRTIDGRATAIVNAVHGLGGVGKTRLAVEYAWQHRDEYTALLFVAADTPEDLRRNFAALVGPLVLNLPEQDRAEEDIRIASVLRWLKQNPGWFLIIDNADTEEAANAVEGLVASLHGGQVLITSRLAKWGTFVERLELDVLDETAAASFLLERTKDRRKSGDDATQAARLAEELGWLALMLEQAGAYIDERELTFAEYLREWSSNRAAVTGWFDERVMKYPRSVAVTWQTSVAQLSDPARHLLQMLAWLSPEPLPLTVLETSGEVETDLRTAVTELARFSLINRRRDLRTMTIHRLVQDVTRRSLAAKAAHETLSSVIDLIGTALSADEDNLENVAGLTMLAPHARALAEHATMSELLPQAAWLWRRLAGVTAGRIALGETGAVHENALALNRRLAESDPDNARWQRDLSVSYHSVGDVLVAQGDLDNALKAFYDGHAIIDRLAKVDPGNIVWQHDLSVSHARIGNVLIALGKLDDALGAFRESLAIVGYLAKANPENLSWQRDLSVCYEKIGNVQVAQDNLDDALAAFRESLAMREHLAKADPGNIGWQRDLSVSHNKIGDVLVAQGKLDEALKAFHDDLAIADRLAKADPGNAGWQRDLSVSYNKVGKVSVALGKLDDALSAFRDDLAIADRLAKADPGNAEWQADLAASYGKLGQLHGTLGDKAEALRLFKAGRAIVAPFAERSGHQLWIGYLKGFDEEIAALERQ